MAFSTRNRGNAAMADMNVTPLVDVMLVLLIIFMVTTPVLSGPIQLELPQPVPPDKVQPPPKVDPIRLHLLADGNLTWNDVALPISALAPSLVLEAQREEQPELRIEADADTPYQLFTSTLAEAKNAGLQRIAFVD